MQIEILINSNLYQTWSLFFRPLFRLVTQSHEAKKRPRRRSHASLTSDLEYNDVFFLLGFFFYVHVFCGMPFNEKQTAYWKSLKFVPLCFSNFWSTSNHKWRRQQQWHLTKGFTCTLALIVWTFIRFCMQVNKNVIIRSLRFENTNIYPCSIYFKTRAYKVQINRQIYNAVKIKTTEGFPSSLAFIFLHIYLLLYSNKKSNKKFKDLRRNTNI